MITTNQIEQELKALGLEHLISDTMVAELQDWAQEPD